jgi:hypothetical protein
MLALFAQARNNANAAPDAAKLGGAMACFGTFFFLYLILIVIIIVGMWKVFTKAGQPGWASIVPFYNNYVLVVEICKKEILWFILMFIPFANIVAAWVICMETARKFGKSEGFGIGLFFLPFIFWPMLGFGSAQYEGRRRSKARDYDDEDEDEDDRPRRSRARDDDDDDDRPRRRRRTDDEDDE